MNINLNNNEIEKDKEENNNNNIRQNINNINNTIHKSNETNNKITEKNIEKDNVERNNINNNSRSIRNNKSNGNRHTNTIIGIKKIHNTSKINNTEKNYEDINSNNINKNEKEKINRKNINNINENLQNKENERTNFLQTVSAAAAPSDGSLSYMAPSEGIIYPDGVLDASPGNGWVRIDSSGQDSIKTNPIDCPFLMSPTSFPSSATSGTFLGITTVAHTEPQREFHSLLVTAERDGGHNEK